MSFCIVIRNPKSGKFEVYSTYRDGIPLDDFRSCEYPNKAAALSDCKNVVDRYGKDNVKLFENVPLQISTSVKLTEP